MRIGIDIDGVLTDIEKWQLDCGSKFYFENYEIEIQNNEGYKVTDIFNVDSKLDNQFWNEYLYDYAKNEPARKYAGEVIDKLKEKGYEIYIITARFLTDRNDEIGNEMKNIVINWLKNNGINYDQIIFSPDDKIGICVENNISIMIEDRVENINTISKIIPVICFHAEYNKQCVGQNIIRCYSWYDIYSKISKMSKV